MLPVESIYRFAPVPGASTLVVQRGRSAVVRVTGAPVLGQVAQGIRHLGAKVDTMAVAIADRTPSRSKGADANGHGWPDTRGQGREQGPEPVYQPAGGSSRSLAGPPAEQQQPSVRKNTREICATDMPQQHNVTLPPRRQPPPDPDLSLGLSRAAKQPTGKAGPPAGDDGGGLVTLVTAGGGDAPPANGSGAWPATAGAAAEAEAAGKSAGMEARVAQVGQQLEVLSDSLSRKLERMAYALGIRNLNVVDNSGDDEVMCRERAGGQG